jgi:hypothetical protein
MAPPPTTITKSLNLTHGHVEKFLLKIQSTLVSLPSFSPSLSSPSPPPHHPPSPRRLSLTRAYSTSENAPKPLDQTRTEASVSLLYANASRNDHSFYCEWTNFLVSGGILKARRILLLA